MILALPSCKHGNNNPNETDPNATASNETENNTDEPEPAKIEIQDLQSYKIVYPASAKEDVLSVVALLQQTIASKAGVELTAEKDDAQGGAAPVGTKEILVGKTNRPETAELESMKCYDYLLKIQNDRLVIFGGSTDALLSAVKYLSESCLSSGKISVLEAGFLYRENYNFDKITVDGIDIGRFAILALDSADAQAIQAAVGKAVGKLLPIHRVRGNGFHYISLEFFRTATGTCEIKVQDGNLVLLTDMALRKETVSYFSKNYFSGFEGKELVLTADANKLLTMQEVQIAYGALPVNKWEDKTKMLKINCYGDSVTEGVQLDGAGTSDYGKSPYPAWLNTLLTDEGYNVKVTNYGYAGETAGEVAVRSGAFTCYTTEDIVLTKDNQWVSLGIRTRPDGKILGTKLYIPANEYIKEDRYVFFFQAGRDTAPLSINGVNCQLLVRVNKDPDNKANENAIKTQYRYDNDITLPKGSEVIPGNVNDGDINIFFAGFNDGKNLSISDFTNIFLKCGDINDGKYIVIGSTISRWRTWDGMDQYATDAEKDAAYRQACYDAFGYHFIDLYEEFSVRGLDIALECGLFADKSEAEIATMRQKLEAHIIPMEFAASGKDGDVHLSREGCRVVAELILERLHMMSYL